MAGRLHAISINRIAAVCFALFVFAGYYKAADPLQFVPVDLTLLFWAITGGFCLLALWRQRRIPVGTIPLLLVFLAMAMGFHWPHDLGSYASQKELRLFSLTALSAFAPLVLLQENEDRLAFVYAIAVLGAVMAAFAVFEVASTGIFSRARVFNTNPILLARASGFAVLLLCLLYWQGRVGLWSFAPAAAVILFGLLASGSRGPLVALLVTTAAMGVLCARDARARARVWGTVLVGLAGLGTTVVYLSWSRVSFARRVLRLLTGEWGDTDLSRWSIWRHTLDVISQSPMGIGWGRLSTRVQVYNDGILMLHPHNIVLEVAAEAGWIAVSVFLVVMATVTIIGLRRVFGTGATSADRSSICNLVVFVASTYWLGCALFSGDVNDNRPLWAMMGMALAAQGSRGIGGFAYGGSDGRSSGVEDGAC